MSLNNIKYDFVINEAPQAQEEQIRGEEPVITIEEATATPAPAPRSRRRWLRRVLWGIGTLVAIVALYAGHRAWDYYYNIGVPVSVSPSENVAKLQQKSVQPGSAARRGVQLSQDSVLGVALNFYDVSGLSATLTLDEPDTTDVSVMLYSRSADHTPTGAFIGSLVIDGKQLSSGTERLGYCGMAGGRVVIGIGRSERVRDYCEEQGGSFFRQFLLLSDGVVPARFFLHGKVERRALGRMADDRLFYIETRHRETLWDFADALREYGFVDAVYITGGTAPSYYRDADGARHLIGDPQQYDPKHAHGTVPWLVFKKGGK